MNTFIVRVAAHRKPISLRWATVHLATCHQFQRMSRRHAHSAPLRHYAISAAEVLRLCTRTRRGDNGVMKICQTCRPDRAASFREDAT